MPGNSHSFGHGEELRSREQETLSETAETENREVTGVKRERIEDQDVSDQGPGHLSSHDLTYSTVVSTSSSKKAKLSKPRGRKPKDDEVKRKSTKRVKKETEEAPPVLNTEQHENTPSKQGILDLDQQPPEDVSVTGENNEYDDPSQLYYSMNTTLDGNNSTESETFNDFELMSSSDNDNDQSLVENHPETEKQDTVPLEDQVDVSKEKTDKKTENGERHYCQFEGCNKSFTIKANRGTHQKKAHGLLGPRAAKRQRQSVSAAEEEQSDQCEAPPAGQDHPEPPPEFLTSEAESEALQPATGADGANEEEMGPISSFLTDSSLGFDPDPDVFHDQETLQRDVDLQHQQETSNPTNMEASEKEISVKRSEVDVSGSKYFQKNPKMMQTAREKSCALFTEIPDGLPAGWMLRSVEVRSLGN